MAREYPMKLFGILQAAATVVLLLAPSLSASAAELEPPRPRQGYYFGLDVQGGLDINRKEDGEWLDPWPAVGGRFHTGQALTRWLDLGLGVAVNTSFGQDWYGIMALLQLEVQVRPIEPLFVRAGVGAGGIDISRSKKGAEPITGQFAAVYSAAIGYDFFPGHKGGSGGFSISPMAGADFMPGEGFASIVTWVGIGISWWTGLPRNQLLLPDDEAYK